MKKSPLTFEEYQAASKILIRKVKDASWVLNQFPREANGLTPDSIRTLPEFKKAKSNFNIAFEEMRKFNATISNDFKRRNSRINRLSQKQLQSKVTMLLS
jgi:hypothetical protein